MKINDVKTIISEYIQEENEAIAEHNAISEILKKYEGKTISKRIFNNKTLGNFKFLNESGMFHIKGIYSHLIGYNNNPVVSIEKFEDYDNCYGGAAKGRINQLQNIDVEKLTKLFSEIENNFNNLRILFGNIEKQNFGSYHNPVYYNLLRFIFDEDKEKTGYSKIKLSDFYYIRK